MMLARPDLRSVLARRAPRLLALIRAVRNHRRFARQYRAFQRELAHRLWPDGDIRVLAGPFAGMRYIEATVHGCIAPHWIGSAECELHDDIETLIARRPMQVVNVGSAEGYYAVGLAKRLPHARVAAFDVDPFARAALRRLAALNRVRDRLEIGGWCLHAALEALCSRTKTLIVCDIEGGEYELLDPARVPSLRGADILVELHAATDARPMSVETGEMIMRDRFAATHDIVVRRTEPRRVETWRSAVDGRLDDVTLAAAIDERRGGPQAWLVMPTRQHAEVAA